MLKKLGFTSMLVLTAAIWGFAFVAQVIAAQSDGIGNFTFNGIRFLLGALSLIPVMLVFERKGYADRQRVSSTFVYGAVTGVILFAAATLQQFGAEFTNSSGKSGFITCLYTVLVPVISFLLFRKKTGANVWIAAVVSLAGLYMLCMVSEKFTFGKGEWLLFAGALMWSAHILVIDRWSQKISPLLFSFAQFVTCGLLSIISAFIFEDISLAGIWEVRYPILYGGLMSVGVAYTLQVVGQRHADPTVAAIVLSCESLFSAIGGLLILNEDLGTFGYIGCAVMFAGVIISQIDAASFKKLFTVRKRTDTNNTEAKL